MIFLWSLIAIFISILWLLWKRKKRFETLPPGPTAYPIVGNLLQFDASDPRKTFVKWHKQYGPIYTVWFGSVPNVFVTSFDLLQELFVKRGDEFADRPRINLFDLFTKGRYGIVNIDGEMWREQRRFSLHVLRNFGFGRKLMEDTIKAETSNLTKSIELRLKDSNSGIMNLMPLTEACVSNIISSVVLGKTYASDDPKFRRLKDEMDKIGVFMGTVYAQLLESFPWLRHIPLFKHFGMDIIEPVLELFFGTIQQQLEEHKKELNMESEPADFAAAYFKEMERRKTSGEDMGYFSEWQLCCIIGDIWSAGMESTITTIQWGILLMMLNPTVQKKVQKEIDEVVGSETLPSMSDRALMTYTSAVVMELQRYANILACNLPHSVKEDAVINGYKIPPGIMITPQVSVVHYDDTVFTDPFEFLPERFINEEGKLNKLSEKLMPFSLGKRICMGEGLARMELFIIFTSLLQKYSFSCVDDEPQPTLKPKFEFTVTTQPYKVKVTRKTLD